LEPHRFEHRVELGKFARLLEAEASFWMLANIIQTQPLSSTVLFIDLHFLGKISCTKMVQFFTKLFTKGSKNTLKLPHGT